MLFCRNWFGLRHSLLYRSFFDTRFGFLSEFLSGFWSGLFEGDSGLFDLNPRLS
jgi:hypothetical protein